MKRVSGDGCRGALDLVVVTTALDEMTLTFTAVTLTYIGQLGVSVVLGVLREQVRHVLHVRHERAGHVPPEVALRGHQGRVEVVPGVGHTARWGALLLAGAAHARDAARHSDASGVLAGPPGGPSVHGGLVIRCRGGQTDSRGWGGHADRGWGGLRLGCGDVLSVDNQSGGAGLPSSRAAPTPLNPPPPRHT